MKHPVKKILSTMFVGSMLMSTGAMTANAVNVAPTEIDFASMPVMAGAAFENAKGIAYVEQEDGSTVAREFDYIAPRGASGNELHEAAIRAAYNEVINPKAGGKFEYQKLATKNNAEVFPSDEGPRVTLSADESLNFQPDYIAVSVAHPSNSLKAVNVALMNGKHSDEPYRLNFDVTEYSINVKFERNREYKGGTAYMEEGDWISARVTSFNGGKYGTADIGLSAVIE